MDYRNVIMDYRNTVMIYSISRIENASNYLRLNLFSLFKAVG